MKKLFMIAAIAAATMSANAQVNFGAQVGGNMGNIKTEYTGTPSEESDNDFKFGFLIGAVAEIPFSTNISFRPELNYIQKGAKSNESETFAGQTTTYDNKTTLSFIELPLNFTYRFGTGDAGFFVGLGPSFGFGIGGKIKTEVTSTIPGLSGSGETDVKFDGEENPPAGDDDAHYKGFDFGANVLIGYKMAQGIFITAGYTKGFGNLDVEENYKTTTSGIQLKLGYMFGGGSTTEAAASIKY